MKKLNVLLAALVGIISFGACIKGDDNTYDAATQLGIEKPLIEDYIAQQGLTGIAQAHKLSDVAGDVIYYVLDNPGTGNFEYKLDTLNNTVGFRADTLIAKYTGKLLNGTTFGQEENYKFNFNSTIYGWAIALGPKTIHQSGGLTDYPLNGITENGLQKGGKIRIILPSYYAYGNQSSSVFPANSPMDFTIELTDIKPYIKK
ncbi:FKBP-type peptidyl-prolyl cis-trans isomerase [bacterium A37T11]|nr:FKBP-type peptidyl-prolyl cis-trans isomerase [bacterium A37T11]